MTLHAQLKNEPDAGPNRDVKNAALALLARREHSHSELVTKLSQKFSGTNRDDIEALLKSLADSGLQSDARFVEAFVRSKKSHGKGPKYIEQQLRVRGVSEYLIAEYLCANDDSWLDSAGNVYRKKFGNQPVADAKDKAKRIRFMASRGFSTDLIFRLFE